MTSPATPAEQGKSGSSHPELTFTISGDPITPDEQAVFDADLDELNVDHGIWDVFNTVLETGTDYSKPYVLRGYDGSRLAGLAIVYECRKTGETLFDPPMSTLMNLPGMPSFVWIRYGITVDQCANPGFVAEGIDRRAFVEQSVQFLLSKYLMGNVVDYDAPSANLEGAVVVPFADFGVVEVDGLDSTDEFLRRGKNLRRKLKKFRNKGGAVRVIEGPMPDELRSPAIEAFDTLDIPFYSPFQDNYTNMAEAVTSMDATHMVHIVATLEGQYAGHQSFCQSGNGLHCQSGAFDRRHHTTYHAYENIIVESVQYLFDNDLSRIDYGPVLNETKKKLMTGFIPVVNRVCTRYRTMAKAMPLIMNRSKISPERMQPWVGLGEQPELVFV
jgi:hypothetical protein